MNQPFCKDCPDHEGCSQGMPCELVKSVAGMDESQHEVPLVHQGRILGKAIVDQDNHIITCVFDYENMKIEEVIALFWIGMNDRIELNAYTPIGDET